MMKTLIYLSSCLALIFVALGTSAALPVNDNFADRIPLSGNYLTVTGSLADATSESVRFFHYEAGGLSFAAKTIWWSWTATDSLPVTLLFEGTTQGPSSMVESLNVWLPPYPISGFPTNSCVSCLNPFLVSALKLYPNGPRDTETFIATAGTTYQIQVNGLLTNEFRFRLIATNAPLIMEQPRSVTASPGAAALLTVFATGVRPLGYQWRLNGTNLPGHTAPMLALSNLTSSQAGDYSVMVSNASGMTLSDAAAINVPSQEAPSQLAALPPAAANKFEFQLCGEAGRFYRIESTTNLVNWLPETSFIDPRSRFFTSSVVFASNSCVALGLQMDSLRRFFRAQRYLPSNEGCNLSLKKIRAAKEMWARERKMLNFDAPMVTDLLPYFDGGQYPACPGGGWYDYKRVDTLPACSIPVHVLEEPR